jgi:beta-mannosidase
LDTYAQVFINGKLIAQAENFFLHYKFTLDVNELQCGYNTIDIKIESPVQYHAKSQLYQSFTYPAPNDVGSVKVASLTRKPQYQFGWDWAPRINTIGFAYPMTIDLPSNIQVEHIVVNTITLNNDGSAQIQLKGRVSSTQQEFTVKSQLLNDVQVLPSQATTGSFRAAPDSTLFQFDFNQNFTLPNAELWWPRGQ